MATAMSFTTSSRHSLASLSCETISIQSQPPRRAHRLKVCCSSSPVQKTLTQIHSSGFIACLRANSAEVAFEAACAALDGGISALEIVMTTPGVFEVLQQLVHIYPTRVLGVGTVLNIEDAERAVIAGAKFFLSPAIVKDIMDGFRNRDVLYIPGVMTPTEILSAFNAGSKIVKIFSGFCTRWHKLYSSHQETVSSHLNGRFSRRNNRLGSIGEYIAKGASSVVLSDAIFEKQAMDERNFNKIRELAYIAVLRGKKAVDRKHNLMLNNMN